MNAPKGTLARALCLGLGLGLATLTPASAAIFGATSGTINSGGSGSGTLTETLNQAGLSSNYISGVTDFDTYVATATHTNFFSGFEWFSNSGTTAAMVTYDLGMNYLVNKMALWNEESSGIGLLNLLVSTDGINFTALLSNLFPTDNPLGPQYLADVFTFGPTTFRYLRMDMSGCPQALPGSFRACAIGEVAFNEVAAVPVPAALPLLLAGLGALGVLRSRRRRQAC